MRHLNTEVLVIGGGATGTGLVRDLSLRGFRTVLVEKSDLSTGTTGRYHGLLHSGGRYVVNDPDAAVECIQENKILRKIIPFAIEDTGGFFVLTPWDKPDYAELFVKGCLKAGIPVEEIPPEKLISFEPNLNHEISRSFRVPDASADSFVTSQANILAAISLGAKILPYHPVIEIIKSQDTVVGVVCDDIISAEKVTIHADVTINASGAWAGRIADKAGIRVRMVPGKGTMIAMNHRVVNSVINRCKYPSDGDIIVPAHTVAILGTTDHPVPDPDNYSIEEWEIKLIIDEAEKLIPSLKQMRFLRAWAGVRPLYKENDSEDNRQITRAFVLLDHEKRDGVSGFITITCGKWTTYRKMAEVTVDLICQKLDTNRKCRTHLEVLENPIKKSRKSLFFTRKSDFHLLGHRLKAIEDHEPRTEIICECELVTKDNLLQSISQGNAKTIDDIRRQTRLGMGPCQGGFCSIRAAGIFHETTNQSVLKTNQLLYDFIQERWKGLSPILWGAQLKQALFDNFIYQRILNLDHLLTTGEKTLNSDSINQDEKLTVDHRNEVDQPNAYNQNSHIRSNNRKNFTLEYDVLVIGAGLSGLVSAWQISKRGLKVGVVSKGWGALYWNTGCIDILGYSFHEKSNRINSPIEYLNGIYGSQSASDHPYLKVGQEKIISAVDAIKSLCLNHGYPLEGSLAANVSLTGSIGGFFPTCIVPRTMLDGILKPGEKVVIVGFKNYHDFFPKYISDNLRLSGIEAYPLVLSTLTYSNERNLTDRHLGQWLRKPDFRSYITTAIKKDISTITGGSPVKIGFPAILGNEPTLDIYTQLREELGMDIFEIPTLPPSLPGIRLSTILVNEIKKSGGQIWIGMKATDADIEGRQVKRILTETASGVLPHQADKYILATGGVLSGGILFPYGQPPREPLLNLPVKINLSKNLHNDQLFSFKPPSFTAGILTNQHFQPVDESGNLVYENVYYVGTGLFGGDYISERSFEGVGLATGFAVGEII